MLDECLQRAQEPKVQTLAGEEWSIVGPPVADNSDPDCPCWAQPIHSNVGNVIPCVAYGVTPEEARARARGILWALEAWSRM